MARMDDAGAPNLTEQQVSDLAQMVSNVQGENVLIIVDRNGVQVIPL